MNFFMKCSNPTSQSGFAAPALPPRPHVSIVVPVLNEAALIGPFLQHLRQRAPGAELIVADGGSTDGTPAAAEPFCDRLIASSAGRARQLNSGAEAARGEVLWFLHADSEVPRDCLPDIRAALADPGSLAATSASGCRKGVRFSG